MSDDGDGWLGRTERTARFQPKQMDTLRDCMLPYIGQVFHFTYAGHSVDDEPYPGQSRWTMDRAEDDRLSNEVKGKWFPSEDLEDINGGSP